MTLRLPELRCKMESLISLKAGVPMLPEWRLAAPADFEMLRGEQIAIFGRNGAGKSRLVDILCAAHPLCSGSIDYDFPSATRRYVSENVKYLAFRDCYGGDTDRNYYLQQRWNQWDVTDSRITMSSGELRKYTLSKVLSAEPCVMILDNPYVGLDVTSRAYLNGVLGGIAAGGRTQLVLVLSREDEIPEFVTHVVEVREGRVLPKVEASRWKALRAESPDEAVPAVELPVAQGAGVFCGEAPEVIRLNGVSIRYGERTILRDLDWSVRRGEHWSLTGPNGSGKSTLLSLVCADNPQSYACDISLFGFQRGSGESIWDIKRHIGYVSPELHRSFKRNIAAELIVAGGLKDFKGVFTSFDATELETAAEWMRVFGIGDLAGRPFMSLSSGEQRLVLLARAFVRNPDLLILDEPMHGLDNRNRALVRSVIDRYCSDPSKTLIMVTHYPEELPSCITHNLTLSVQK